MKVKIINNKLSHYNEELKVQKLNYDMVEVQSDDEKLYYNQEDVKIIPENEYEKAILRCKDIVKIKLNRGISLLFYTSVLDNLEKTIGSKVESIDLLKDDYRPLRKGLWEKLLLVVVNEEYAFTIDVTGKSFGNNFDVIIAERRLEDFIDECKVEIEWLENEIEDRNKLICRYKKAIKDVISNNNKINTKLLLMAEDKKASQSFCSI
jgi:hypothetical protein